MVIFHSYASLPEGNSGILCLKMAQKPPQDGHVKGGKKHMTNTSGFFRDAWLTKHMGIVKPLEHGKIPSGNLT